MKKIKEEDLLRTAVQCTVCKNILVLEVNSEDLESWKAGELIQNAMPYLTAGERELLKTGICGECFDMMFG